MEKYTLKELKKLVYVGMATDVTNWADKDLPKCYEKIGYSTGIYGINGGLYKDKNGDFYVITERNSNLFRIF